MTLLQPAALAFFALAPVIVVLYLLKLQRQSAQVSTLMFWQRVTVESRRRALFQRLRQLLSLLLHLLIFALLLFALARPEFRSLRGAGGGTVVVLDCRARMQAAVDGNTSRFDAARKIAEGYLRRASADEPVALLAAESAPRAVVGFSQDEKPLLDGLRTLNATDSGGRIEDAIRAGGDLLNANGQSGRIVVVTDHVPDLVTSDLRVEWQTVDAGVRQENVGIDRLAARPLPNSPETEEVLVEIENFGSSRQTGSVELSFDGAIIDVKPFDLAPGERRADVYPTLAAGRGLANARGWLSAHLTLAHRDAYALDDDAYAVIPPSRTRRVLLVSPGNLYLEGLLKADATVAYELLAPERFDAAQAATFDAVILDDFRPPGFDQMNHLSAGNFLFLRRTPFDVAGAAPLDRPAITDQDRANPILRLVDLREVLFFRATALATPGASAGWRFTAPAQALDWPLIITGERLGQRLTAFAFSATDSELPLRIAFPLLIHNTLDWLTGRADPTADTSVRAGDSVPLRQGEMLWTRPQHSLTPLPFAIPPAEQKRDLWQPTHDGFYLARDRWIAVNTADRDMSVLNGPTQPKSDAGYLAARRLPVWPPWIYLALAAFALCLAEWWSFHRRRTE